MERAMAPVPCPKPNRAECAERLRFSAGARPAQSPHSAASRRATGFGRRRRLSRQRRLLPSRRDHRACHPLPLRAARLAPVVSPGRAGPHFALAAQRQTYRLIDLPAPRGQIVDSQGRVLAGTNGGLAVSVDFFGARRDRQARPLVADSPGPHAPAAAQRPLRSFRGALHPADPTQRISSPYPRQSSCRGSRATSATSSTSMRASSGSPRRRPARAELPERLDRR